MSTQYKEYIFEYNGEKFQEKKQSKCGILWLGFGYDCPYCNYISNNRLDHLSSHLRWTHKTTLYNSMKEKCPVSLDDAKKYIEENRQIIKEKNIKQGHIKRVKTYKERYSEYKPKKRKNICEYKVFTLDWFIFKYGEELGRQKYNERSEKISKQIRNRNIEDNGKYKARYSKISQLLFNMICEQLDRTDGIYYGTLNHEFSLGSHHNYDFVDTITKSVIEFNGDKWHANPRKYKKEDISLKKGDTVILAEKVWSKDKVFEQKAIEKGYRILWIWEKDFEKNPNKTLKKCINFINGKNYPNSYYEE